MNKICQIHGPILNAEQEAQYGDDERIRHFDGRCEDMCAVCHDIVMMGAHYTRDDVVAYLQFSCQEEEHYRSEDGCSCPPSDLLSDFHQLGRIS